MYGGVGGGARISGYAVNACKDGPSGRSRFSLQPHSGPDLSFSVDWNASTAYEVLAVGMDLCVCHLEETRLGASGFSTDKQKPDKNFFFFNTTLLVMLWSKPVWFWSSSPLAARFIQERAQKLPTPPLCRIASRRASFFSSISATFWAFWAFGAFYCFHTCSV